MKSHTKHSNSLFLSADILEPFPHGKYQNWTQFPLDFASLSAVSKSPQGSSALDGTAAGAGAGARAGTGAGFISSPPNPPRSHRRSMLEDPITGRDSTGEERGVKLEVPGI